MIEIVAATRLSAEAFARSPLGRSRARLSSDARLDWQVRHSNRRGLPQIYNARIDAGAADVLVFTHDDVWIDDPAFAASVLRGLSTFDVVGVAGNRRCRPDQPGWAFVDDRFTWDARRNLSGAVAHGSRPSGVVTRYGRAPAACELLDGVLLAARRETLARSGVRFDPLFPFHFYDLDFCRSARARGLALGTWPIAITHASGGAFGSPAWRRARDRYRGKWQEPRLVSGDA